MSFDVTTYTFCINISNGCNLKCDYCFNNRKDNLKTTADFAKKKISELLVKYPNGEKYVIDLSGKGEPLLNLDTILEISDYCLKLSDAIRKEILVSFVTNGTLLTEKTVNLLQNAGILFGISLDGNQHQHDKHRKFLNGADTYEKIMQNIRKIERREFLGCAITITNDSFNLLDNLLYLSQYFNTISVKPVRSSSMGINLDTSNWKNEYWKIILYIIEEAKQNSVSLLKKLINGDDYLGKYIYRTFLNLRTINRCDESISRFCVDGNNTYGCPVLSMDIANELRNKTSNYPSESIKENINFGCGECEMFFYCGGECTVEKQINKGLNKNMCEYKKMLISYAMYLKLEFMDKYFELFEEIIEFCLEKKSRLKKNDKLYDFLIKYPHLSFTEGKKLFEKSQHNL